MALTKEQISKNVTKWQKENTDTILVRYPKGGLKQTIEAHLAYTGEPMVRFIERAVLETIERDKAAMSAKAKAERKAKE